MLQTFWGKLEIRSMSHLKMYAEKWLLTSTGAYWKSLTCLVCNVWLDASWQLHIHDFRASHLWSKSTWTNSLSQNCTPSTLSSFDNSRLIDRESNFLHILELQKKFQLNFILKKSKNFKLGQSERSFLKSASSILKLESHTLPESETISLVKATPFYDKTDSKWVQKRGC